MPKGNRESGLAPQEVVDKVKPAKTDVASGAAKDVVENSEAKAIRLFAALEADLKRRKKEAKDAGRDPKEVRGFDKSSELYDEYILAFNENQLDALEAKESKLQAELEKADKSNLETSKKLKLFDEWREVALKVTEVSNAKRARRELSDKIARSEEQISNIQEKVDVLGKEDIAMSAEIINLEGAANVASAQLDVVDKIAAGQDIEISPSVPVSVEALEEMNVDGLVEIVENQGDKLFFQNEEQLPVVETKVKTEVSRGGRGVDMISGFFAAQLSEDKKAKVNFREAIFTAKLNEFVGDDEDFAKLLLKNDVFVKSVEKMFDVGTLNMLGLGNKAMDRATEFAWTLGQLRSSYDSIKAAMAKPDYGMPELPEEVVEKSAAPLAETKVSPEASEQEVRSKFKPIFNDLKERIESRRKYLADQQSELKAVKFFDFKKKAEINNEININIKEVGTLFNRLVDLGNQIRDRREILSGQPDRNFDKINLYSILIDQIDSLTTAVKTKKEKPGSVGFFDKYSKAIALGSLLFAVGSEGERIAQKPDQKTAAVKLDTDGSKLQSVMPKLDRDMGGVSQATVDKFGQTLSQDISVEPKAESWGGSSAEPTVEAGYTPAETVVGPIAGTEEMPSDKVYKVKQAKKVKLSGEFARKVQNVEDTKPVVEAVVEPKKEEKIEQAPEVRYERKLSLKEISEKLEDFSSTHPLLTSKENSLVDLLYKASRTGGEEGDKLLSQAEGYFIALNTNVVSVKNLDTYQSFINGIREGNKKAEKKNIQEDKDKLNSVSEKLEAFSANNPLLTSKENSLVDLLYKASKTSGQKGNDLLSQAEGYYISLDNNVVSASKLNAYKGFIDSIKEGKGI